MLPYLADIRRTKRCFRERASKSLGYIWVCSWYFTVLPFLSRYIVNVQFLGIMSSHLALLVILSIYICDFFKAIFLTIASFYLKIKTFLQRTPSSYRNLAKIIWIGTSEVVRIRHLIKYVQIAVRSGCYISKFWDCRNLNVLNSEEKKV